MTTQSTSLLGLALPVTGELTGTWGDTVNTAITSLIDTAVAGTTTLSADADVTLTTAALVANQARQAVILWTAGGTVTRNITAPAASKTYAIVNKSSGTQSIVLRGVGPTTGVTIVKGESAICAWDGTDFVKVSNTAGEGSFTNLAVSGTTTLSGLTASTALALDASKNAVSVANTGTGSNVLNTSPTLVTPALGTPSALVGTNITGTAAGLTAGNTTTNANLTGAVTSVGNATSLGSFTSAQLATALTDETGSGANVFATSPVLVTPALGTPSALVGTNITGTATGLSIGGNAATATNATSVPYSGLTGTIPTWNQNTTGNAATATNVSGTVAVGNGGTGATTLAANGILFGNGTSAVGVTAAGTAAQVLTSNGAGVAPTFQTPAGGDVTLTGVQTLTNKTFTGYTETVFALTGTTPALNPANGTVQTWTLSGNSTPTNSIAAGQSMTLMIDDGAAFTITWPSVNWKTNAGVAPTLNTTGFTAIVLWRVGGVLYGARVGDA